MSKNFFDDNGKYHNVQNLTLEQIYANGYAAGYDQAQKNFVEELEKLKTEFEEDYIYDWGRFKMLYRRSVLEIVDKHIAELKGESKQTGVYVDVYDMKYIRCGKGENNDL